MVPIRQLPWFQNACSISVTHPEALEWLYGQVCGLLPPVHVCEIGSWKGGSAIVLAEAIRQAGGGRLECVDDFSGFNGMDGHQSCDAAATAMEFRRNTQSYPDVIVALGGSPDAASLISEPDISLLFVDGDHRYEAVLRDLAAFAPKVRPGGIIAGHDAIGEPGVLPAVQKYFGLAPYLAPGDVWYIRRPHG